MKKILKKLGLLVGYVPFVMLTITLVTSLLAYNEVYHNWFYLLPDSVGYSILTNLVFLYHFSFKKYCIATRVTVYSLLLMNLVSLLTTNTEYYNTLHDVYIYILCVVVLIVLKYMNK